MRDVDVAECLRAWLASEEGVVALRKTLDDIAVILTELRAARAVDAETIEHPMTL